MKNKLNDSLSLSNIYIYIYIYLFKYAQYLCSIRAFGVSASFQRSKELIVNIWNTLAAQTAHSPAAAENELVHLGRIRSPFGTQKRSEGTFRDF